MVLDEGDRMSSVAAAGALCVLHCACMAHWLSFSCLLFAVAADNAQDCGSVELCTTAVTGSNTTNSAALCYIAASPTHGRAHLSVEWVSVREGEGERVRARVKSR